MSIAFNLWCNAWHTIDMAYLSMGGCSMAVMMWPRPTHTSTSTG
jgi:hypothetical protein